MEITPNYYSEVKIQKRKTKPHATKPNPTLNFVSMTIIKYLTGQMNRMIPIISNESIVVKPVWVWAVRPVQLGPGGLTESVFTDELVMRLIQNDSVKLN